MHRGKIPEDTYSAPPKTTLPIIFFLEGEDSNSFMHILRENYYKQYFSVEV